MTISAMRKSFKRADAVAAAALLLVVSAPAIAQEDLTEDEPDAVDVIMTPLDVLNLRSDEIPEILLAAWDNPYDNSGLDNCDAIRSNIGDLDAILGDDFDTEDPDEHELSAGRIAQKVVGSFIPFKGLIREISGANAHERNFRLAIGAGMMRRAYLKGLGEARGCPYPARPAPPEMLARLAEGQEPAVADSPTLTMSDDGTEFVSAPVVQPTDR